MMVVRGSKIHLQSYAWEPSPNSLEGSSWGTRCCYILVRDQVASHCLCFLHKLTFFFSISKLIISSIITSSAIYFQQNAGSLIFRFISSLFIHSIRIVKPCLKYQTSKWFPSPPAPLLLSPAFLSHPPLQPSDQLLAPSKYTLFYSWTPPNKALRTAIWIWGIDCFRHKGNL